MHVTIKSVTDADVQQVDFLTDFGPGIGIWKGLYPTTGQSFDVEIDIDAVLETGVNMVVVAAKNTPSMRTVADKAIIVGQLEQNEDDGVAIIRMGNSVLMVEFKGEALPLLSWVQIGPVRLSLSDTNS
ncbi:MAG: hypothetical protein ACPGTU_16060 [Myxococcota bacterium]